MRLTRYALIGLLLACLPLVAAAREVAGVELADQITLAGTPLQLNGAGVREKFFFDIYVGALYLPRRTRDAHEAIAMPGPKRVVMHFLYKEVDRDKLVKGWNEGFENNLDAGRFQAIAPRLAAFNRLFVTVRKGDRITIDSLPEAGTRVSVNGQVRGDIDGDDFYAALLQVWLGDEPADDDLKRAMLGGE